MKRSDLKTQSEKYQCVRESNNLSGKCPKSKEKIIMN